MKSKFVRRLSSVRPSSVRVAIISEPNARISFKFHLWLPLDYSQNQLFYFIFLFFFYEYFSFLLTWDPKGGKIAKRYTSDKSQPKAFKLFLNFLSNCPHKTTLGIFEILKIEILMISFVLLNMEPYESQNFKTLLLLQITFASFQTFSEFSSQ